MEAQRQPASSVRNDQSVKVVGVEESDQPLTVYGVLLTGVLDAQECWSNGKAPLHVAAVMLAEGATFRGCRG